MNDFALKKFIARPLQLHRIELWAATTTYVFAVFFMATSSGHNRVYFEEARIPFNYYEDFFFPQLIRYTVLYLSFLLLNFKVVPKLIRKEAKFKSILLIILTFLTIGLVFGITDTYYKNYLFNRYNNEDETYSVMFQGSFHFAFWLLLMFGFYTFLKYAGVYLLYNSDSIQLKYRVVSRDGVVALVLWMVTLFLMLISEAGEELILGWAFVIPSAILLYCYSFQYLIPKILPKKKPFASYLLRILPIVLISIVPVTLLVLILIQDGDTAIGLGTFNAAFQAFVTVPLTWLLFRRRQKGSEELQELQTELGRSNANLDFLRSQINPHFLFNALNTIYGTAIQEKADRTSEGIEKLGDMMRFMLQENMQDKISLAREIEYLNNYIGLQRLRTDSSPSVLIKANISQDLHTAQIAPMLLIPFVENAFKHGISLREPSHINITLEVKDKTLYFDVYNSKHPRSENDPEKNKSGIGLRNVKQRLQHLYKNRHELIIRETGKEFFVHLTLQLV